ncbi:SagB/ThcOx family dehydrogenase [Pedobacter sp. WC2501]|uniref:SagB/ThcOx family dehydrogenase n=1 Tax=Pedobacter sp. WC2501 TaxID=3461400 RepID=UPI004045C678
MNQETLSNLLSEHRLSNSSLDFLETIKFQEFHKDTPERFEIISYVNNSPDMARKIFESYYEVGFCDTYNLKTSDKKTEKQINLEKINEQRQSIRKFSSEPVSQEILGDFFRLFYTITGEEIKSMREQTLVRKKRNIASGGSMYPTEIFMINNKITELPKGAYRYNVFNFQLELIHKIETEEEMHELHKILMKTEGKSTTTDFENASVFLIFTSVLNKHSFKYQDFGLALSLIEIGEFIHAAYLASSALDIACCTYGSMINDKMSAYLDLKNPLHIPLTYMAIGNKVQEVANDISLA